MVIFYSISNVAGINSYIIYSENNSLKINRRAFLKKVSFELIQEQLEERAACPTLPSNLRAKICKFSDTQTDNAHHQKGTLWNIFLLGVLKQADLNFTHMMTKHLT